MKAVFDLRHRWLRRRADLDALAAATAERDSDDATRDGRSLSDSRFMLEREANAKAALAKVGRRGAVWSLLSSASLTHRLSLRPSLSFLLPTSLAPSSQLTAGA